MGGVFRAIRTHEITTASPVEYTMLGGIVLDAGTDIKVRVFDIATGITSSVVTDASFEYVLLNKSV